MITGDNHSVAARLLAAYLNAYGDGTVSADLLDFMMRGGAEVPPSKIVP